MYFYLRKERCREDHPVSPLQNNEKLRVWLCFCLFMCDVMSAEKDRGGENQVTNAF